MMHPTYLGWQIDWPVFVKIPFKANGREWARNSHFPWAEMNVSAEAVAQLYSSGKLHHNKELEAQAKVGDRLEELTTTQLASLVGLLNAEVKSRTNSVQDYNAKKCKQSKIVEKQKALLRRFLRNNRWIEDDFYKFRDQILNEEE